MQPNASIPIPDSKPLADAGAAMVARAKVVMVTCQGEYELAGEELRHITRLQSRIRETFKDSKEKAHATHKAITKAEADLLALPIQAERQIKEAMSVYLREEERRRREEQARLQAAELAKAEEAKLSQAIALDEAGETEAAELALDAPTVAPVVEIEAPRAAGISSRKKWRYTIIDASLINRPYLDPADGVKRPDRIGQQVSAMGPDAAAQVGGIRVYEDVIVVARR